MLGAFNTICRSVFTRRAIGRETGVLRLAAVAVAFALALLSGSAQAQQQQEQFLVFKSLLSAGSANWCMDDAAGIYQPNVQIAVSSCSGAPSQTFGYENGANLTLGGLCLDGQPSAAGSPVVIAECDGSDHQVWVLQPFQSNNNVFLIGNSEGMCVSVNGAIGQRMPLLLAACEENPAQGWVFYTRPTPARPVYGTYSEPQYYWRGGERYCWYDRRLERRRLVRLRAIHRPGRGLWRTARLELLVFPRPDLPADHPPDHAANATADPGADCSADHWSNHPADPGADHSADDWSDHPADAGSDHQADADADRHADAQADADADNQADVGADPQADAGADP